PHLVDQYVHSDGSKTTVQPKVLRKDVVSPQVGSEIQSMMEYVIDHHFLRPPFDQDMYSVGGKTGTAQIAKEGGGYKENDFNGTYMGFVGGNKPQYVIVVTVIEPKIAGYAGSQAAQPIFGSLGHMLIDNFGV